MSDTAYVSPIVPVYGSEGMHNVVLVNNSLTITHGPVYRGRRILGIMKWKQLSVGVEHSIQHGDLLMTVPGADVGRKPADLWHHGMDVVRAEIDLNRVLTPLGRWSMFAVKAGLWVTIVSLLLPLFGIGLKDVFLGGLHLPLIFMLDGIRKGLRSISGENTPFRLKAA